MIKNALTDYSVSIYFKKFLVNVILNLFQDLIRPVNVDIG
jgi:hypothetical protein